MGYAGYTFFFGDVKKLPVEPAGVGVEPCTLVKTASFETRSHCSRSRIPVGGRSMALHHWMKRGGPAVRARAAERHQ